MTLRQKNIELGAKIKVAMTEAGVTVRGMAEDLNREQRTVARWRAGDSRPTYKDLLALTDALAKEGWGGTVDYFIEAKQL